MMWEKEIMKCNEWEEDILERIRERDMKEHFDYSVVWERMC